MNLVQARELKLQIRSVLAASCGLRVRMPFAIGISLTSTADDYRVAIMLASQKDRPFLEHPGVRRFLVSNDVSVQTIGTLHARTASTSGSPRSDTLRIGASVGHVSGGDGSLGFFAVRPFDGRRGFVSCNHVIALADQGNDGDAVISPSRIHGGLMRNIATLDGNYPRLKQGRVDCAFAVLADAVSYDPGAVEGGRLMTTPAAITEKLEVIKTGSVTGMRHGVVTKIEVDDLPVRYGDLKVMFDGAIEIDSTSTLRFSAGGDSGALIHTRATLEPAGLLFASSDAGGLHNAGSTWAHPITQVIGALGVNLIVE
jgi:hypothetical protein